MAADISDKITDTRNSARPNSARVSSGRSAGASTLSCDDLTGWPTNSKVHFVTYTIDSNSEPVAGTQLDCSGIVSGNSITSFTVVDGTDTGNQVNDVVEMLPTAAWGQDLATALIASHNRDGTPKSGLTYPASTFTTPTINDFSNATHTHATNAQGGQLGVTALLSTIFSSQISTGSIGGAFGGTYNSLNLGGIRVLWGTSAAQSISAGGTASQTLTFPSSQFSTTPTYISVVPYTTNITDISIVSSALISTQATITYTNPSGTTTATPKAMWLVIGVA